MKTTSFVWLSGQKYNLLEVANDYSVVDLIEKVDPDNVYPFEDLAEDEAYFGIEDYSD